MGRQQGEGASTNISSMRPKMPLSYRQVHGWQESWGQDWVCPPWPGFQAAALSSESPAVVSHYVDCPNEELKQK
jgi:hypothetical protein